MNIFKAFFGGKKQETEEEKRQEQEKEFDVLKFDGVRALRSGNAIYAIKCFNHALDMKEDLEIRDYLSQAFIHNNELLPAYEQLQKLAEEQPENEEIFIRMANVAYMMEDYGALTDACEHALLINKDDPQVLLLYARGCIGQEDQTNAIAMLTKCITISEEKSTEEDGTPNYANDARLLRGQTLFKMENIDEAEADADLLLEKIPSQEDALLLKARIEKIKDNKEQAIDYYNKVIDANPFCVDAFRERSVLKQELGDEDGAEEDMRNVQELSVNVEHVKNGDSEDGEPVDIQSQVEQAYRNNNPFGLG